MSANPISSAVTALKPKPNWPKALNCPLLALPKASETVSKSIPAPLLVSMATPSKFCALPKLPVDIIKLFKAGVNSSSVMFVAVCRSVIKVFTLPKDPSSLIEVRDCSTDLSNLSCSSAALTDDHASLSRA